MYIDIYALTSVVAFDGLFKAYYVFRVFYDDNIDVGSAK